MKWDKHSYILRLSYSRLVSFSNLGAKNLPLLSGAFYKKSLFLGIVEKCHYF
ncbi:hypothetical protein HMPREF0653_01003 [Prevotella disiens JCM 6334 = ATCC 29426]|uniref:Uncharacterized protein n=2 Tax=Prevotella disiens TaxID=28130 RepID=A0A379E0B4_9BACT|nr:hypothetical protein HMPREF0653_01003 [Prevotella disiens JCM 6334 = ATCC 29426]SUB86136.1 Uncharacterised protein [Prevotella disiens]